MILDLYYIPVVVQSSLHTDDSFQFSAAIRDLRSLYYECEDEFLPMYAKKYDTDIKLWH